MIGLDRNQSQATLSARQLLSVLLVLIVVCVLSLLLVLPLSALDSRESLSAPYSAFVPAQPMLASTPFPSSTLAYVSAHADNYLALIDTGTWQVTGVISLPATCSAPQDLAIAPDGGTLWVACHDSNSLAIVERATQRVVSVATDVATPEKLAFTRDGNYALAVGGSYWGNATLSVVDTHSLFHITLSLPSYPNDVVVHPYLPLAYIACATSPSLLVVDTSALNLTGQIDLGVGCAAAVFSEDASSLYTANTDCSIAVIDVSTRQVTRRAVVLSGLPADLALSPDGQQLYVPISGQGCVQVVDTASLSLVRTIPLNPTGNFGNPKCAAFACDGRYLWVTNLGNGYSSEERQVAVIDTSTLQMLRLLALPDRNGDGYPDSGGYGLAMCPPRTMTGAYLTPLSQTVSGAPGQVITHTLRLINWTGSSDRFTLSLGSHTWPATLSSASLGPMAPGATLTFTLQVTVPTGMAWYASEDIAITVRSFATPAQFSTTAHCIAQAFAPPVLSFSPDRVDVTQQTGQSLSTTLELRNGNGVTLSFAVSNLAALVSRGASHPIEGTQRRSFSAQHDVDSNVWADGGNDAFDGFGYPYLAVGGASQSVMMAPGVYTYTVNGYTAVVRNSFPDQNVYRMIIEPGPLAESRSDISVGMLGDMGSDDATMTALHNVAIADFQVPYFVSDDGVDVAVGDPRVVFLLLPSRSEDLTRVQYRNPSYDDISFDAQQVSLPVTVYIVVSYYDLPDIERWFRDDLETQGLLPSWLSVQPLSGTLASNSAQSLAITLDAHNMQPLSYATRLCLRSDDPLHPTSLVPVSMTVLPAPNMGWVEGTVTNSSTRQPLLATVRALGQPYTVTTTAATGRYQLWLSAGDYALQGSSEGYITQTADVTIRAGQGITQDLALTADVPVLQVTPSSVSVTQETGVTSTCVITLSNAGPAPLLYTLQVRDTTPAAQFLQQYARTDEQLAQIRAQRKATGRSDGQSTPNIARYPVEAFRTLQGSPRILAWTHGVDRDEEYAHTLEAIAQYATFILSETATTDPLELERLLSTVDVFLVPEPENDYFDVLRSIGANWADVLTRYVNQGLTIVAMEGCSGSNALLLGAGLMDAVPVSCFSSAELRIVEPGHVLARNVPTLFTGDNATVYFTVSNGQPIVQMTDSAATVVAVRDIGAGHVVMLGFDFYQYNAAMARILANAVQWLGTQRVAWMTTVPVSGTVAGYSAASIQLSLDSIALQPGDYSAVISIRNNTPATPDAQLSVSMTVLPATQMGRVEGTVSDAWSGKPLTATVQLADVYTTTARPNFALWAPANTYALTATASGYYTLTHLVTITAGGVVTANLKLEPAQPRIAWPAHPPSITVPAGAVVTRTLAISNTGPSPLHVSLREIDPTLSTQTLVSPTLAGKRILYDRAHGEPDRLTYYGSYQFLTYDLLTAGGVITDNWYFPVDAAALEGYDVLWIHSGGNLSWGYGELGALRDWLRRGGALLVMGESSASTGGPASVVDVNYLSAACTSGTTDRIQSHPISEGVHQVAVAYTCWRLAPSSNAQIVVYDPQGAPHVVAWERDGGKAVVVAGLDFNDSSIDQAQNRRLVNNILAWLSRPSYSDVPWLQVNPTSATLNGHTQLVVTLQFSPGAQMLGAQSAILAIEHDDPAQSSPIELPLSMNVVVPSITRYLYLPLVLK